MLNSPHEIEAGAVAHDMKEQDVIDSLAPATSSLSRKEDRTTMSSLAKEITPTCSIYDRDFRSSGREAQAWHPIGSDWESCTRSD